MFFVCYQRECLVLPVSWSVLGKNARKMIKVAHLPLRLGFFPFFLSAAAARRLSFSALEQHLSAAAMSTVISGLFALSAAEHQSRCAAAAKIQQLFVFTKGALCYFLHVCARRSFAFSSLIIDGPKSPKLTPPEVLTHKSR